MSSIPPSVLIVRLDAIGDALTLVPLVAALRRHGLGVAAVLRPGNASVFSRRALDRIHIANSPRANLSDEIRAAHYGYALVATEKPQGYLIAYRARIPNRIGFENGWGKPLKTLWVRALSTQTVFRTAGLDPRAPHECEVTFSLARTLIPDAEPSRDPHELRPYVLDDEPAFDERIAVQITDKWDRLGASLAQVVEFTRSIRQYGTLRFICARAEKDYGERFAAESGSAVECFEDLAAWKSAVASSRAVVAPDSGAAHVAGMTGTPVVACFAAAEFALQVARWAPWAAPNRIVRIEPGWPTIAADALGELVTGRSRLSYKG